MDQQSPTFPKATRRAALLIAVLSSFIVPFMGSSITVALPAIEREFGIDAVLLGWIPMAVLLSTAMLLVPFGRIADIYGQKKVYLYGTITFTISCLLCALSLSGLHLIAFRAIQGVGLAMIFGTGTAILTSVYPVSERGKVLGITVSAVYLGLSLGPFFGGFLTEQLGWRSIFLTNIPLGFTMILSVFKLKHEWAGARGERFDYFGSFIYSVTLLLVMLGFSILPAGSGFLLILSGLLAGALFIKWEERIGNPVLDIGMIRANRVFALSNLAAFLHYGATFGVTYLLSLYLQYTRSMDAQRAGLILVSQPLMQVIFSPLAGKLSDRVEPRVVASAGMAVTAICLLLFAFLDPGTSLLFIVSNQAALGFGFALFSSPNVNAIMSSVGKRDYGVASGMMSTVRSVGQAFSMGLSILVFALLVGRAQITPATYPLFIYATKVLFVIFALLCTAGVVASLARGKVR